MIYSTTSAQDYKFGQVVDGIGDELFEVIKEVLEMYSDRFLEWVGKEFDPEDVFDKATLEKAYERMHES